MRTPLLAIAVVAMSAIALTGCTTATPSGASGVAKNDASHSKGSGSNGSTSGGADRTYTAADLTTIVTDVKKTLKSDGTIVTNDDLKQLSSKPGGLQALLGQAGVTISPASCGALVTSKLPSSTNGFGLGTDSIGAALYSVSATDSTTVSVASVAGKALPDAVTSQLGSSVDSLLASCGTMSLRIKVGTATLATKVSIKKTAATSKADQTIGLVETVTVSAGAGGKGQSLVITTVEARKGNLFIVSTNPTGTGAGPAAATALETNVNAVIDAAASLG